MRPKCIIRLEYYPSDQDDIVKELELLNKAGWEVVTTDMGRYNKLREEFNQVITLGKMIEYDKQFT